MLAPLLCAGQGSVPTGRGTNAQIMVRVTFENERPGSPLEGSATALFHVDDQDKSNTVFVKVKPKVDPSAATSKPNTSAVTSAAALRTPPEAQKAFHKGMDAWEHRDFQKAAASAFLVR